MGQGKYCSYCGSGIDADASECASCGRKVERAQGASTTVTVNNVSNHTASVAAQGKAVNKWIALVLCLFFGFLGVHKFYEGKIGMGVLYIFTGGLFCIGVFIDFILILCKPATYYVK